MASDAILATAILAGMCALMWVLARLAKKRMGIGSGVVGNDGLRIVGKRPLDQKNSLWVIEIAGGRHILIGTGTDGGVTKVDDISEAEYEAMTSSSENTAPKRLRIANEKAADTDGDTEQRFATVGESFSHLLNRAKNTRSSRKASGE